MCCGDGIICHAIAIWLACYRTGTRVAYAYIDTIISTTRVACYQRTYSSTGARVHSVPAHRQTKPLRAKACLPVSSSMMVHCHVVCVYGHTGTGARTRVSRVMRVYNIVPSIAWLPVSLYPWLYRYGIDIAKYHAWHGHAWSILNIILQRLLN